jgi:(p)ppGpp synthase/HD superfamily hydrolase
MYTTTERYDKIAEFISTKHAGQFRKNLNGQTKRIPYEEHCKYVATMAMAVYTALAVETPPWKADVIGAIGLLHDVIEDTPTTTVEVSEALASAGYSPDERLQICKSVLLLTKSDNYEIFNYLREISKDRVSCIVKICDITHNSSDLGPGNLLDKYKLAKSYLCEGL